MPAHDDNNCKFTPFNKWTESHDHFAKEEKEKKTQINKQIYDFIRFRFDMNQLKIVFILFFMLHFIDECELKFC